MKFGVVNKSTTVNRFVLHTLQRNITHLAVITRKTNIKLGYLKGGGDWKRAELSNFQVGAVNMVPQNYCFFSIYYPSHNYNFCGETSGCRSRKNIWDISQPALFSFSLTPTFKFSILIVVLDYD